MPNKPFSQACENTKTPILQVLLRVFKQSLKVLEIGSGTGQHAVHFAAHLPHLTWQPSDRAENIAGIAQWLAEFPRPNLAAPQVLDVMNREWPGGFDAVFSANTAHIMPWPVAQTMVREVGKRLPAGGVFALYGPFKYNGDFTTASNANFDYWLKSANPEQGIRDFEAVNKLAESAGLILHEDNALPANNQLLVWQKT